MIIVHGVGDPLDGDALNAFVEGLTATTRLREAAPRRVERRVVPGDADTGSPRVSTYPVHRAVLEAPAPGAAMHRLHLREVYWGDLSRVKGSAAALLLALFDLMFGMRHVVVAARRDARRIARRHAGLSSFWVTAAERSARAALWLARGPMFALNILAAAVGLAGWWAASWAPGWQAAALHMALLACTLAGLPGFGLRTALERRHWSTTTSNALAVLGGLALTSAWFGIVQPAAGTMGFVEKITTAMSLFAALMALAAISTSACAGLAWWCLGLRRDPPAPDGRPADVDLLARPLVVIAFCTTFGVGLFVFVVMVAWTAVATAVGTGDLAQRIDQGLHLFALVWFSFIAVAGAFLLVAAANGLLNARGSARRRHRFIVSPLVVAVFVGTSLAYAILFVPVALSIEALAVERSCRTLPPGGFCAAAQALRLALDPFMARWVVPIEAWKPAAVAASGVLVAAVAYLRVEFLTALDLVLDVVAHFRADDRRGGKAGAARDWAAMLARFRDVVDATLAETGAKQLVVVAHSQGTLIALQALGLLRIHGQRCRWALPPVVAVSLATMGSPADDLYRHYLPLRYRFARRLPRGLRHWWNLYRLDDFIGTRIETGVGGFPRNLPIDPRGHTDYWRDREVLEALRGWFEPPPWRPAELPEGHEHEGRRHRVLLRGEAGPPLILLHELPGMTPQCLAFADRLAAAGYRVHLPLLFGEPGERAIAGNIARLCIRDEFRRLAFGAVDTDARSTTAWLRSLGRRLHEDSGAPGIGVVGMCLTGGFVLAMLADAHVLAGVASQPAMPLPFGRLKEHVGVPEPATIDLPANGSRLFGLRFTGDPMVPRGRFDRLDRLLGDRFCRRDIPSGEDGVPKHAHSVLTEEFRDVPGHPTRQAFDEVLQFLATQLPA